MSKRDDFIEGVRRAEGEYDQSTDLSRYLRNSQQSHTRVTRDEFVERLAAEARTGLVRVIVPWRRGEV